jgi:hypothetical protein
MGDQSLHPITKAAGLRSFRNFVSKHVFTRYCWLKTYFFVKRDHGPPAEGAASFHTTRWSFRIFFLGVLSPVIVGKRLNSS